MKFFRPVLSVLKFERDDNAMAIADAPDYVNELFAGSVETPFSGYGKSGYGGENRREALWNYVQTKCIAVAVGE